MSLDLTILAVLETSHPRLMKNAVVKAEVGMRAGRPVLRSEFDRRMRALEAKGDIAGVADEDHGFRWRISQEGMMRLEQANS